MEKAPMPITIRETTITPGVEQDAVQIRIADAQQDDQMLSFELTIHANVRPLLCPTVAHVQRQAITMAQEALSDIHQRLGLEIVQAGCALELPPKNPTY
jgi:homoaconitase/3-isopropylmalate dehydratase large subunit